MLTLSCVTRSLRGQAMPTATLDWRPTRVTSQEGPPVCRSGITAIQLQNVVRRAHERPFALDLVQAPQEELAESSGLLDLAKHRLDDRLAHRVHGRPDLAVQLARHAVDPRRRLAQRAAGTGAGAL